MTSFATLRTPAFIVDRKILSRNAASMTARMKQRGVQFRPHLKTAKSAKVAELVTAGNFGGITVSTIITTRRPVSLVIPVARLGCRFSAARLPTTKRTPKT